jgi:hypothetical protein
MVKTSKRAGRSRFSGDLMLKGMQQMLLSLDWLFDGDFNTPVTIKLQKSLNKVKMSAMWQAKQEIEASSMARKKMMKSERNKRYYVRTKKGLVSNKSIQENKGA